MVSPLDDTVSEKSGPGRPTPATQKVRALDERLPDHLKVVERIARGGMASLLLVDDTRTGRRVVAKVVDRAPDDDDGHKRFLREVELGQRFADKGVVPVLDHHDDLGVIVLPYLGGGSLEDRLKGGARLPVREARDVARALLDTLAVLHEAGVVHRDLKPSNVLFDDVGRVFLADLGVARDEARHFTVTGMLIGTPAYMAPEQLRGRAVDGRADVYGLGATLYEAATGQRHSDLPEGADVSALVKNMTGDAPLAAAVAAMLAPAPEQRPDARAARALLDVDASSLRRRRLSAIAASVAVASLAAFAGVGALLRDVGTVAVIPVDGAVNARTSLAMAQLVAVRLAEAGVVVKSPLDLDVDADPQRRSRDEWLAAAGKAGARRVVVGHVDDAGGGKLHVTFALVGEERATLWSSSDVDTDALAVAGKSADALAAFIGTRRKGADEAIALALHELNANHWEAALAAVDKAQALGGATPDVLYLRSVAAWWASLPDTEVRADIARALAVETRPTHRAFLEGLTLFLDGKHDVATAHFQHALREAPGDRDLSYGLFEAQWHSGEPDLAIATYRKLVERYPDFRMASYHVLMHASIHDDVEEQQWALEHFRIAEDPEHAGWTAGIKLMHGDGDAAIATLLGVAERSPSDGTKEGLGQVYAVLGEMDLARGVLTTLKPARPNLAVMLARVTGDQAALRVLLDDGARAVNTDDSDELLTRGLIYASNETEPARVKPVVDVVERRLPASLRESGRGKELLLIADANAPAGRAEKLVDDENHEIRALARALVAREHNQLERARDQFRQAAARSNGRLLTLERALEAQASAKLGDDAGVLEACRVVIVPRGEGFDWAAHVGPCLLESARASLHLGKTADALRDLRLLLKQRSAAADDDDLTKEARALLSGIEPE